MQNQKKQTNGKTDRQTDMLTRNCSYGKYIQKQQTNIHDHKVESYVKQHSTSIISDIISIGFAKILAGGQYQIPAKHQYLCEQLV